MRTAIIERNTNETQIKLSVNLDGAGSSDIKTGVGFMNEPAPVVYNWKWMSTS